MGDAMKEKLSDIIIMKSNMFDSESRHDDVTLKLVNIS